MSAKEDGVFFSTQKDGANSKGYGTGVVQLKVPVEKLLLDDIFSDEAHLRFPLKNRNQVLDISEYLYDPSASVSNKTKINEITEDGLTMTYVRNPNVGTALNDAQKMVYHSTNLWKLNLECGSYGFRKIYLFLRCIGTVSE